MGICQDETPARQGSGRDKHPDTLQSGDPRAGSRDLGCLLIGIQTRLHKKGPVLVARVERQESPIWGPAATLLRFVMQRTLVEAAQACHVSVAMES